MQITTSITSTTSMPGTLKAKEARQTHHTDSVVAQCVVNKGHPNMIEMYYSSLCCLLASFPSNLFLRSYIYNFERGGRRGRRRGI